MAGYCCEHKVFYENGCPCCLESMANCCALHKDRNGHNTRYTKRYYAKYRQIEDGVRTILTVTSTTPDPGFTMNIQTYCGLEPTKTIQDDTVKCVDCGKRIPKKEAHPVRLEYMDTLTRREWRCATCDGKKYGSTTENPHGRSLAMDAKVITIDEAHKVDNLDINIPKEGVYGHDDLSLAFMIGLDPAFDQSKYPNILEMAKQKVPPRYEKKSPKIMVNLGRQTGRTLASKKEKEAVSKVVNCTKPVETEKDMENWLGAALTHLGNIDPDYDVDIENFAHAKMMASSGLIIKINGHRFTLDIREVR